MLDGSKTVKWEIKLTAETIDTAGKFSPCQLSSALSPMFCLNCRVYHANIAVAAATTILKRWLTLGRQVKDGSVSGVSA